ncbi:MAG TPA: hypothetical protein PK379_10660, partial [Candidatus Hydrogenedentes bacterium]|nr:hypothetical protein [Candidatus Hydrogenedentota bacterium]
MNRGMRLSVVYLLLGLVLAMGFALPARANIEDIYESDGILRDLVAMNGETIIIDTGATPPTLLVDASPIGYLYRGRVVDGVAVFDFADVYIEQGVTTQISGNRPLAITASGDMTVGCVFDVSAGKAGGGNGGQGGPGAQGGTGGIGGLGGSGGKGGNGGKGGDALPSSQPGEDGGLGEAGQSGQPGQAGSDGLSATSPGQAGQPGYGNAPGTGGVGGTGGQNTGSQGKGGAGSTVVGQGGAAKTRGTIGDGRGGSTANITIPFTSITITYGLPGSGGSDGNNGQSASSSNAQPGTAGAPGQPGGAPNFNVDPNSLVIVAGPGGGG